MDAICPACAEDYTPGPRCVHCGERQTNEAAPAPTDGYGGDSLGVAVICVVATAAVVLGAVLAA